MGRRGHDFARSGWCRAAPAGIVAAWIAAVPACAATLAEKTRESGCVGKPVAISSALYKCVTASGAESFFNVPASDGGPVVERPARRNDKQGAGPAGFPRVDAETQKGRDELRRKVLADELASEEKSLADARAAYGSGAPAPLPEEKSDAEKYRQRIGRLRQAVDLHERNVEALKKEIASTR
jgi:hypothetical protein